jgi:dipeptidyl aminopeptidase/acylaminoacyl peptidase
MHPDGSALERLTNDPAYDDQAAFSPDGRHIVFVTTRAGGRANLWILDLNTRQAAPLTSGNGSDFRPAWSPDGQWIAFSSDRGNSMEFAKGRWEHLHLVDIYIIRPDGSGLKRLTHGDFCGSPKWWADSASVIAYCMPAEDTWTFRAALRRVGLAEGGETAITRIDIATGKAEVVDAGPGVKLFPAVLPSGEVAFLRADSQVQGAFYSTGKAGPPVTCAGRLGRETASAWRTPERCHLRPARHENCGARILNSSCSAPESCRPMIGMATVMSRQPSRRTVATPA